MKNHETTSGWLAVQILVFVAVLFLLGGLVYAAENPTGLTWNHNTETDLAGYYVYESTAPGGYGVTFAMSVPAGTNTITFPLDHVDGTFYWVVTAYDTSGNQSGYSNEVTATFDHTTPAPPTGCQVVY
jgi:hypothetical protein